MLRTVDAGRAIGESTGAVRSSDKDPRRGQDPEVEAVQRSTAHSNTESADQETLRCEVVQKKSFCCPGEIWRFGGW